MILVTGGAGFIGSQIVKGLNALGHTDIIIVDDLTDGRKFINLCDLTYADYFDKTEFLNVATKLLRMRLTAIFHQGACSDTTEWNGRYMMENNFSYSKAMLNLALAHSCPFYYASSAAVYGNSQDFKEVPANEKPINVYGYSKLLFDQYVRQLWADKDPTNGNLPPIVGLRYFNVYGPGETHKGAMSSVAYHFHHQIRDSAECRLFAGTDGYKDGEQLRDFVYVGDIVKLNLWLLANPQVSGIFNAGTGKAQTFNDVADAVIQWHGNGQKTYIPFPDHLKNAYQNYTHADLSQLRSAGYTETFLNVASGVKAYLDESA